VSISMSGENEKDTCANIKATKEFTAQIISEWFAEAANYTSVNAPHGVSEWVLSGLTKAPSQIVKPSRVAEAAFSMECKLLHFYDMVTPKVNKEGKTVDVVTGTVFLGQVQLFHIRKDILQEDGTISLDRLKPISRLGGISYGRTLKGYELVRPQWDIEKEKEEVKKVAAL